MQVPRACLGEIDRLRSSIDPRRDPLPPSSTASATVPSAWSFLVGGHRWSVFGESSASDLVVMMNEGT